MQGLMTSSKGQRIVRAMVELSRGFGVESTAEFVDDAGTLELLRSFGVRYAQGFHIGSPGPESDAMRPVQSTRREGTGGSGGSRRRDEAVG